jgi:hypothetical protein
VIPIADVLRHREATVELSALKSEYRVDKKAYRYASINVGLFDKAEISLESSMGNDTWASGKLLLVEKPQGSEFALSAGFQYADVKGYWEPFVVARQSAGGARVHYGALRVKTWRLILGVDADAGDWTLAADFESGPKATVWIGACREFAGVPGLYAGAYAWLPVKRSDGYQYQSYLGYSWRL